MLILPTIDETPGPLLDGAGNIVYEGFPADDLYEFRLYSFGTQVVMWATIGLVFAALASRLLDRQTPGGARCVSEVVRLTLVSHAMTDAMAAGRFPTDEPLNALGHRQVDATIDLGSVERALLRTGETRQADRGAARAAGRASSRSWPIWTAAGGAATCWRGAARRADASGSPIRRSAPHGGESVVDLIGPGARVA